MERMLEEREFSHASQNEFEEYRICSGIPASGSELTVQYNPLEANLSSLISWTKGCYIGQEVIARLDTYKKVQKRLVKIKMAGLPPSVPVPFYRGQVEAGVITSAIGTGEADEVRGLAYLRVMEMDGKDASYFRSASREVAVQILDDGPA